MTDPKHPNDWDDVATVRELATTLQKKVDDLQFQLLEYDRAVRLPVTAVALSDGAAFGSGPCMNILVTTNEPLAVQPGMVVLVMLPKEE